ncbi:MAG: hypothetical protein Kow00109_02570 [Acidobacteriota bacterium]
MRPSTSDSHEFQMSGALESLGRAVIVGGAALVLGNEILSQFRALRFTPVLLLWILVGAGMVTYLYRKVVRVLGLSFFLTGRQTDYLGKTIAITGITLAAYAVVAALWFPPNTWDSMAFHLPRQVRWIQQRSLDHFPTYILQQLFRGPLAETWQADLQILFGTDHVTKLVSVASWGMAALFAALVAGTWGASSGGRWLAVGLTLTIPVGFLGSLTTKNDLMVTAWVLAAVWLSGRAYQGNLGDRDAFLLGCAAGMAGLTKATGWFFLTGLAPWLAHAGWRVPRRYRCAVVALAPAVLLNAGHWSRNLELFGQPIYVTRDLDVHPNQSITPSRVVSRLVKEASFHLATPWDAGNRYVEHWILQLHDALGVDILDPATTYPDRSFSVRFRPYSESEAGAPLHFLLLVLLPPLAWRRAQGGRRSYRFWSWAPLWLVVWTALVTRWEPFLNPRLHLTPLALGAALVAALGAFRKKRETADGCSRADAILSDRGVQLGGVLFLGALLQLIPTLYWAPRALQHQLRTDPVRWQYQQAEALREPYEAAIAFVASRTPAVVGLDSRGHPWGWEYPLMRGLRKNLYEPHFVAVNVGNVSARLSAGDVPLPDLIIAFRPTEELLCEPHGVPFRRIASFDFLTVLEPAGKQPF